MDCVVATSRCLVVGDLECIQYDNRKLAPGYSDMQVPEHAKPPSC